MADSNHPHDEQHQEDFPELTADDVAEEVDDAGNEEGDVPMDSDGDDDDDDDRMVISDSSLGAFYRHGEESIFSIKLHPGYPNPPLAVSGGSDDTSFIWNVTDGEPVQQLLPKHTDSVTMVDWNADGTLVASGGLDGIINVWRKSEESWGKWDHIVSLGDGGEEVQFITWHPKGNVLAAGLGDGPVWMWEPTKADPWMQTFTGHAEAVTAGQFTPDGKKLVTTSTDGSLNVYHPRDPSPLKRMTSSDTRFRSEGGFVSLAVSPDSRLLAVGSVTGESRVVSLAGIDQGGNLSVVSAFGGHKEGESVEGISFIDLLGHGGSGASHLVTAATDGKAIVWDLTTQRSRVECVHYDGEPNSEEEGGALTTLVVHNQGPLFTTASSSGTLRTWDARSGQSIAKHEGFTDGVLDADVKAHGPDGWVVVGAGDEGVALIFKC